ILLLSPPFLSFFLNDPATTEIYTLSLHDALPISSTTGRLTPSFPQMATVIDRCSLELTRREKRGSAAAIFWESSRPSFLSQTLRSEEHTSELQSRGHLVCRLLLEKKKKKKKIQIK